MKPTVYSFIRGAVVASLLIAPVLGAPSGAPRLELAADSGWKFNLGDPSGAEARSFADESWRSVDLPHDWSIEGRPEENNPTGRSGGYFPAGTGWYRKTFSAPPEWKGNRVSVEFDGVYRGATVYLNGQELGTQPYGYTSFRFDLTAHLDFTEPNVVAVRVDNSEQPNSRWYSGSGIYRHVRVVVTEPTHVAHWGVFVTTPEVSSTAAKVSVQTRVANESGAAAGLTLETTLLDERGQAVGKAESVLSVAQQSESEASHEIAVANPALWSPDSPRMYRAVTRLLKGGELVDQVVTPFGIRSIEWSAEKGFVLNGEPVELAGGNVHHDNGPLGAAAFDRAEERRVELLKAAGYNAVRAAHNPPSPAFLDACDRIGLLVLNEAFDTWAAHKEKFDYARNFDEWWRHDLSAMVMRDRNHPSIIGWSIGNEIPELTLEKGGEIAERLAARVRSLDATRPTTTAYPGSTSGPTQSAVFAQVDIVGYNYNLSSNQAADHSRLPERIMMTTESFAGQAFEEWRLTEDHPYIIGEFVWTAMDYLGESGIGSWMYGTPEQAAMAKGIFGKMHEFADKFMMALASGMDMAAVMASQSSNNPDAASLGSLFPGFPWHASNCGDIDLIGHRKPHSYYRDILWNGGDRVYATVRLPAPEGQTVIAAAWAVHPTVPSWTWPGRDGSEMEVEVYSGAERVRLYLNGDLIGEQPTGREQQFKTIFTVPYAPGELKAVGLRGDREVAESVLATAGDPVRLRLTADRTTVLADGQDLSFVTVEAVDVKGRLQPNADQEIEFNITGPGVIAAVGNGDGRDAASYQGNRRKLYQGRALAVVRTSKMDGTIQLTATTSGLSETVVTIHSKKALALEL
jgi:beta-galactosidase